MSLTRQDTPRAELRILISTKSKYQFESATKKTPQGLEKSMGMKRLACIVGEHHEPNEAGYPEGRTPYFDFNKIKIPVRVSNKKRPRRVLKKVWA